MVLRSRYEHAASINFADILEFLVKAHHAGVRTVDLRCDTLGM